MGVITAGVEVGKVSQHGVFINVCIALGDPDAAGCRKSRICGGDWRSPALEPDKII